MNHGHSSWQCSAGETRQGIEVRQSGRRPRTGGSLGHEDFDDRILFLFHVQDRRGGDWRLETTIPPGERGIVLIGLSDLTRVDSTLTFHISGPRAKSN